MKPTPAVQQFLRRGAAGGKSASQAPAGNSDLRDALLATDRFADGKGDVGDDEGGGGGDAEGGDGKPAKKQSKKTARQSTEPDRKTNSGILKTMLALEKKGDKGKTGGKDDEGGGGKDDHDEGGTGDEGELTDEELEQQYGIDDDEPPMASQAVKDKFKRQKEGNKKLLADLKAARAAEKKAQKDLEEAKKGAGKGELKLEDHEEFKKLKAERDAAADLADRLSLEQSPRFQEKYDSKIQGAIKKMVPFVKMIRDDDARQEIVSKVDAACNIAAGEDNDVRYFTLVSEIIDHDKLPKAAAAQMMTIFSGIRELTNARAGELSQWKETRKEYLQQDALAIETNEKALIAAFDGVRNGYEQSIADRLKIFRADDKTKAAFKYDELTEPELKAVRDELKACVKQGGITPKLLQYLNAGVQAPFLTNLNKQMHTLLLESNEENQKLRERLAEYEDADPLEDTKPPRREPSGERQQPKQFRKTNSGILRTLQKKKLAGVAE